MWIQVPLLGLLDGRIALREDANQLAGGDGFVDQAHGALARDRERHERVGEEDGVAKGKDRDLVRDRQRTITGRELFHLEGLVALTHGNCSR